MKLVRYETVDGAEGVGIVGDDGNSVVATGYVDLPAFIAAGQDAWTAAERSLDDDHPSVEVRRLLAPHPQPGKMLFLGRTFRAFRQGLSDDAPPFVYSRVASSIVGPEEAIRMPGPSETVLYEGELLIIIGRAGRRIAASDAASHIFGYTQVNDITWTDWIHGSDDALPQISMGKNADTFCPMGPEVITADSFDVTDARCTVSVNGDVSSVTSLSDMAWSLARLIEWLSQDMTLWPGDVIATGTSEAKPIVVGDEVIVQFDGFRPLVNQVVPGWRDD